MSEFIRWGVLSTAKIGVQKVIPAMQKSQFGKVTAICSRNADQARTIANQLGIEKAYATYDELLADPEIDAIYNPLPNHMHVEWTLKALQAGKHVLCEKPIGLDEAEAKKLTDKAASFPKLKVMEAFMYRFHPQWKKTAELISTGAIGKVKTMQAFFSYYNVDPGNIRNKPEVGGGALMDIGCYCISFPRFIFAEEPHTVIGMMDKDPQMGTDRMSSGILLFPEGKTATFTCSTQLTSFQRVHILGDEGQIVVEIPVNAPPTEQSKITLITKSKTEDILFDAVDQYTLQADAFASAILTNKDVPTPLSDAIKNMAVIDAIRKSTDEQCWIKLG
ncbi:Gfo/Idh/MocA family protein [Mangrovibacterium lignilyticum]|uniref:Gfo/Idh/MocA family protein n=1 Tax=Mangrovibacterium lignilyticum TaxID=2668052 RepID=UPI0013D340A3|nr:Gfo/Idh/MocA family oxidoreductase [Mangrovibacterium lignilyticum]